jgi:hypothetical protein
LFNQANLPLTISPEISREGDSFLLKIPYHNQSAFDLEDIKLSFSAEGPARIESFKIAGSQTWSDAGKYVELASLPAGASGELTISLHLIGVKVKTLLKVTASYSSGNQIASESFTSNEVAVPASLSISAAAYYYSRQGDQLGIGPIPPIVGIPTRYWILIDGKANGNLSDFALTAYLPQGVSFTGNKTMIAGHINYNEAARQIIWQVGNLTDGEAVNCGFEVEIIPESFQVGRVPLLIGKISYSGYDQSAQTIISGTAAEIDASLPQDKLAHGDGIVGE